MLSCEGYSYGYVLYQYSGDEEVMNANF